MPRAVTEATVDAATLEAALRPRDGIVVERALGGGRFDCAVGAVRRYRRTLRTEHLPDGRVHVTQVVDFSPAVPYFGVLFVWPLRRRFGRIGAEPAGMPWWAPPDRLDARAGGVLGTLAAVAVIFGYLNTLFTQTIAFAADEFHADNGAQGIAGAVVRAGGLLALLLLAGADRRGRRTILLVSTVAGLALAATGAMAPSLPWLTASQVLARAFSNALLLVVAIVAAEEMPAGSRAYAMSLLAMAAGLGAGFCVMALRFADLGVGGWRIVYVLPLIGLLLTRDIARRLPESKRFTTTHETSRRLSGHGGRLALLAFSGFLLNLFIAPGSQFSNRFLHDERHYSGGGLALLTITTATPGGLGIIIGGRLADVKGRRLVGAVSTALGTLLSIAFYFVSGSLLYALSLVGSIVFDASIPALAVYGPELFPTALRGKANGIINVSALFGSAVGLAGVGVLADRFGRIGPAMAIAGVGPLLLAVLIVALYPETAHRELEDLNPEDRPTSPHRLNSG